MTDKSILDRALEAKAEEIAKALNWQVVKGKYTSFPRIANGEEVLELYYTIRYRERRLGIRGVYPAASDGHRPIRNQSTAVTVSITRHPIDVGNYLHWKLLPGYREMLQIAKQQIAEYEQLQKTNTENKKRLLEVFGPTNPGLSERDLLVFLEPDGMDVRICVEEGSLQLLIQNIPVDVACKIGQLIRQAS